MKKTDEEILIDLYNAAGRLSEQNGKDRGYDGQRAAAAKRDLDQLIVVCNQRKLKFDLSGYLL